jgi:hypothetical protein
MERSKNLGIDLLKNITRVRTLRMNAAFYLHRKHLGIFKSGEYTS